MLEKIKPNVFQLTFDVFGSAIYLIILKDSKILIDTSSKDNEKELLKNLREIKINPEDINIILLTHTHWDHIGNLEVFPNAKIYKAENINQLKLPEIKVIKTPGHSKDSLVFLYQDILFSGDTIFKDGIGRTDFPGGNKRDMDESLEKLGELQYKILCPGHV